MVYRLTEDNATAPLPLRQTDLFKVTYLPPSLGVRIVNIVGSPSGKVEFGEYVVRRGASHFNHSSFRLDEAHRMDIERLLDALGQYKRSSFPDDDEEPERRRIALWTDGKSCAYRIPVPHRHRALKITTKFRLAFECAWAAIIEPVRARRMADFTVPDYARAGVKGPREEPFLS